jgi:hypothetical protein
MRCCAVWCREKQLPFLRYAAVLAAASEGARGIPDPALVAMGTVLSRTLWRAPALWPAARCELQAQRSETQTTAAASVSRLLEIRRSMKPRFDGASPGDMLLQRGIARPGHQVRWRTVIAFSPRCAAQVEQGTQLLAGADSATLWRVVSGAEPMKEIARWLGDRWG